MHMVEKPVNAIDCDPNSVGGSAGSPTWPWRDRYQSLGLAVRVDEERRPCKGLSQLEDSGGELKSWRAQA